VNVVRIDGVDQPAGTTVTIDGTPVDPPTTGQQIIEVDTPNQPPPPEQGAAIGITPEAIGNVEASANGKAYKLAAGVYRPFTLRGKKDVSVVGDGMVLVEGSTSLHGHAITVRDCERVTIKGLHLTGGNAGIGLYTSKFCVVENCVAFANKNWGIFTSFCDDCSAINNRCFHNRFPAAPGQHGIYFSNDSQRPTITGNVCIGHDRSGIQCNGDKYADGEGVIRGALIANNTVAANKIGFNMDGLIDSRIENNVIHNGLRLFRIDGAEASSRNKVTGNQIFILDGESHGVWLRDGAKGNEFVGNTIYVNKSLAKWVFPLSYDPASDYLSRNNIFWGPSAPVGGGQYGKTPELLRQDDTSIGERG